MKILVIGGSGYIGSILTPLLLGKGNDVTVYDSLIYNQNTLIDCCHYSNFNFIKGDITDLVKIEPLLKQNDIIIFLAAIVGAPACKKNPFITKIVNYDSPKNIINKLSNNQKLIFPTTNSGYGIGTNEECTEETPLNPISEYGRYKVDIEKLVLDKQKGVSLRFATLFGMSPRMRLDLLVNDFVHKAFFDKYIVLFEEHFRRNFLHVRDASKSFIFAIDNYENMLGQAFNVGLSNANLTKLQLAEKIKKLIPEFYIQCSKIGEDPDKRDYIVSNKKIESIGWKADFSLEDGIRELINGYSLLFTSNLKNI